MEENSIIDAENWRGKGESSYKEIVLRQVSRIAVIGSKELTHGWWRRSLTPGGGPEIKLAYISDGRRAYCEAVNVLHDLLMPKFDNATKEASEKINTDIRALYAAALKDDKKAKNYINEKLAMMREMFQHLCIFLEKLGWFEEIEGSEDDE